MTIRDLRDALFEIKDQEQNIDIEDIGEIMGLWERYMGIEHKVDELLDEQQVSMGFIKGWQKEKSETINLLRSYRV